MFSDSDASVSALKDGGFILLGDGAVPFPSTSVDGGVFYGPTTVLGHSAKTLYQVDIDTKVVSVVHDFVGCDGDVTDLAIDKGGRVFVTTGTSLYRLNDKTAECSLLNSLGSHLEVNEDSSSFYPNSLSFVPAGTLDPDKEVLVGYKKGDYLQYDSETGQLVKTFTNALGPFLFSSGDILYLSSEVKHTLLCKAPSASAPQIVFMRSTRKMGQ